MTANSLKIIFAGTPEFSAVALQALINSRHTIKAVYTQPDRPAGRGRKLTASPVKELALQHHIPLHQPVTLRDENEQKILADIEADIMVVVAYGLLLPKKVLEAPRLGCINIHGSLLPRWRGAAPIQRAILAGDNETGITIMQMDEGLDTGPMLYKIPCKIGEHDTSETLYARLAKLGAEAVLETLNQIAIKDAKQSGQAEIQLHSEQFKKLNANKAMFDSLISNIASDFTKQDDTLATYAHKITKEEGRIDWQQSAIEIDRKVRAFNPWPVAFTDYGSNVLRVWQASVMPASTEQNPPGTIMDFSPEGIAVATGNGILLLEKIQLPGERILSAADFFNSTRKEFSPGTLLGSHS